jgi:hypothetical protein
VNIRVDRSRSLIVLRRNVCRNELGMNERKDSESDKGPWQDCALKKQCLSVPLSYEIFSFRCDPSVNISKSVRQVLDPELKGRLF